VVVAKRGATTMNLKSAILASVLALPLTTLQADA
jgi:hypothetical protein